MIRWKTVEYSRTRIINAGKIIKKDDPTEHEIDNAMPIIDNWRAAHAYPLHVLYIHLRSMAKSTSITVAERLKRLDSIIAKLKREPSMNLWTMQDLGGCRFIVNTVDELYQYVNMMKKSRIRHKFKNSYDYITNPKSSGYRSLHIVYEYHSDSADTYNRNMLIEIQFRTYLQHIWATALETMGLYTNQALKAGEGDISIKRFFALIASLFALEENAPIIPNTSDDIRQLIEEIKDIDSNNHYLDILSAIKVATNIRNERMMKDGYSLLILDYSNRRLKIKSFKPGETEKANSAYKNAERQKSETTDTVLVRVNSFDNLKKAYPNYFADISEFIDRVKQYLS